MENTQKKSKHIAFWILMPLFAIVLSALMLFYFDLANGPLYVMVLFYINVAAFVVLEIIFAYKLKTVFRLIPYGGLLLALSVSLSLAKPSIMPIKAYEGTPEYTSVIHVKEGDLRGVMSKDKEVRIFPGIQYGTVAKRWTEASPAPSWEGTKTLEYFAPKSYQPSSNPIMDGLVDIYAEKGWHPSFTMQPIQDQAEDSLYLNVWAPKDRSKTYPVLVYYHGGSLTSGSSASSSTNGEEMARHDVIMVTVSYRLGVFGYFAHPELMKEGGTTGNYGLLDQIAALKWVNENIACFGGDPKQITIAGESAGSSSVSALCTSPLAKGLFRYAIGESSSLALSYPPHTYRSLENAYETGEKILKEFGCENVEELRKIPAEELVNTKYANSSMTLDGKALTKTPYQVYLDGENNEEALLNGYNVKEADAFVVPTFLLSPTNKDNILSRLTAEQYFGEEIGHQIYDLYKDKIEEDAFSAFNEIFSVYWFIYPHESWSNLASQNGVKVYRYHFTKENGYYGTYHSGEIVYAYGNLRRDESKSFAYDETDDALSKTMVSYWSNFVKNGDPNASGLPSWEDYTTAKRYILELGETVRSTSDPYQALYPLIQKQLDRLGAKK